MMRFIVITGTDFHLTGLKDVFVSPNSPDFPSPSRSQNINNKATELKCF